MSSIDETRVPQHDLESVKECSDLIEAEMVCGLLRSHGINAEVLTRSQWIGRTAILGVAGLRGIHVGVPAAAHAEAQAILEEVEAGEMDLEADEEDALQCPSCGSTNAAREAVSGFFVAMITGSMLLLLYLLVSTLSLINLFLFMAFLLFAAKVLLGSDSWSCRDCGHTWKV